MFKLKLQLYKNLGIFIPYFKRKLMNTIYNHLKNTVDNHIRNYANHHLFEMNLITNSTKPYSVKYAIRCQTVNFSIEAEYINHQIEFNFSIDACNSSTTLFEIASFVKFIESMPQENLKIILAFSLRN